MDLENAAAQASVTSDQTFDTNSASLRALVNEVKNNAGFVDGMGVALRIMIGVRRKKFPFEDETPLKTPGVFEEREYYAHGVINDEEVGKPSLIVSVRFAG